jgi:hypothetical protein
MVQCSEVVIGIKPEDPRQIFAPSRRSLDTDHMPATGSVMSTLLLSILDSTQRVCGFPCRRSAPHLAGQALARRLLFPVRAHVDLVPAAAALSADNASAKPRHFSLSGIARHVDQCGMSADVVEAGRDQPLYAPSWRMLPSVIGGPTGCLGFMSGPIAGAFGYLRVGRAKA